MDAGLLEIYQYVPQAMLEGVDLPQAGLDTFAISGYGPVPGGGTG